MSDLRRKYICISVVALVKTHSFGFNFPFYGGIGKHIYVGYDRKAPEYTEFLQKIQPRVTKTGAWLTVLLSTVNGTDMGDQEWRDALFLSYYIYPPDIPTHCDGCNAKVSVCHDLYCKKIGIVTICHIKFCDGISDLSGKAFTP